MEMLNTTEAGLDLLTTDEAASIFDVGNATVPPTGSSDVISGSGMSADVWLKKVSMISTPILVVMGKFI